MGAAAAIFVPSKRKARLGVADLMGKRECEQELLGYIRDAWTVLEPTIPFLLNWHHELIAEYLEAVTSGQIKRLAINCQPRYTKKPRCLCVWPTWAWARRPEDKFGEDEILSGAQSRWDLRELR